jgi:AraC-like DNA-binding protein
MDGLHVSEHASERGCWRISRLAPTGPTALHVSAFHAYEESGTAFRRRRELPDGSAVLIFNLGKELRVEDPAGVHAFGEGHGLFSGASATYVITETDGAQTGAQIKFSLLGARLFFGRPLGELGDALVDPSEAFDRSAAELGERVADAHSQEERLQLLSRAVELRLHSGDAVTPELAFAFGRLSRADVRVAEVARDVGMGRERFSKTFRREFGLSPKKFARIRRFARALRERALNPALDGAALAALCGYVDQAHMIHDFQEFAGSTPAALWRRELPDAGGFVD